MLVENIKMNDNLGMRQLSYEKPVCKIILYETITH